MQLIAKRLLQGRSYSRSGHPGAPHANGRTAELKHPKVFLSTTPDECRFRIVVKGVLPDDDEITFMHRLPVNDNRTVGADQAVNCDPQRMGFGAVRNDCSWAFVRVVNRHAARC
jgi:hypothetical protein